MERIIALLSRKAIAGYHFLHIRGLDRYYDIVKVKMFKHSCMGHCTLDKGFGSWRAVFCKYLLFERTRVHAYSDRKISRSASVNDLFYPVHAADISGIYAYLVNSCRRRFYCKAIVKVDIRNKRYLYSLLNCRNKLYS